MALATTSFAGCADEPITPKESAAKKSKPAATTAPPSPSASAGGKDVPEVLAVRHYNDVFNRAFTTLDPAPLLAAADPGCASCEGSADVIRKLKKSGGHYDGFRQRILEIGVAPKSNPPVVQAVAELDAFEIVPRTGAKPQPQKARKLFLTFELKKRGDTWIVDQITQG